MLIGEYSGTECSGQGGFSNCYASASGTTQGQPNGGGSAAVFKYNFGGATEVSSLYPSITGSEFVINLATNTNVLSFSYTAGANDPSIHYVAVKQANGFALFYDANPITSGSFNLSDYFKKNPGYSHITFFNGSASTPGPVPEPATWAMMIGGFALIGASLRRRKTALRFA